MTTRPDAAIERARTTDVSRTYARCLYRWIIHLENTLTQTATALVAQQNQQSMLTDSDRAEIRRLARQIIAITEHEDSP